MSNPYYTRLFDVMPGAIIRSDPVEQEFVLIQQGFDGVDIELQAQDADIQTRAPINSPALTGTPTAPTPPLGDASTRIATTDFVAQQAFATNLPGQTGNDGAVLRTDGTNASWARAPLTIVDVTGTSATATHGFHYVLRNAAKTTVTVPASVTAGHRFRVSVANGRFDNDIAWGGHKHENLGPSAPDNVTTLVRQYDTLEAEYVDASFGFKVKP